MLKRVINTTLLFSALITGSAQAEALHYGAGISYDYDDFHVTDKTYHESYSWDLGIYSNFDHHHSVYADVHLYTSKSTSNPAIESFIYVGLGLLYVKDNDNYVHEGSDNEYEENYGIRFPVGVEYIHQSGLSVYAEIVPIFIVEPDTSAEAEFIIGSRYYFY